MTQNPIDVSLPVLKKRQYFTLRWTVLIVVQILIIAHIVIWLLGSHYGWFGGKTITPIEPSEGMEFVKNGIVNAGAIFFALALLSTLIFGRWFCGWGCHIVFLQDGCYWLLRKFHIRPKPFKARFLMLFPFGLAVYMFIWPLFYRFVIVKLPWPEITIHLFTEDYWSTFASPLVAIPFLFICGFATVYVLGSKGFCTYGCPYGGFFKPLDAISPMHVRVNDDCQQCGKCTAACTSNVRVSEEVNLYKMVIDSGCMKIMDCIDACPNDALRIGFGPVAVGKRVKKRKYDLSLRSECFVAIWFLIGFFAFRSLYATIPMLMAVGMSLVGTWVMWKAIRVIRDTNVKFHKKQFKLHSSVTLNGYIFLSFSTLVCIFTLHSAMIQTFKHLGDYVNARDNNRINAMPYYNLASPIGDGGYAFFSNPNIDIERAMYHQEYGNFQEAQRLIERIDYRVGADEQTTMLIAHNLQNFAQYPELDAFYLERLQSNPHWLLIWEDYVGWLKRDGLYDRAIVTSERSVELNPQAKRLRMQLALLEMGHGNAEVAVAVARGLTEEYDNDPVMWMLLARALDRNKQFEQSKQAIKRAQELQRNSLDR